MLGVDFGTWLIFILGIIVGGVLFSSTFRDKFMRSLRKFFTGVSGGADNLNRRYDGRGPKPKESPRSEPKRKPGGGTHYHFHVGGNDAGNDE